MPTTNSCFHKGIVLAGGSGTRLYPLTRATSKQLLPVYDKPMVYYPLSVLMLAGIRQILVISTPADIGGFQRLLGDGSDIGLDIQYAVQPRPEGLAQAFIVGREFVGDDCCALVLGDNLFYGQSFHDMLVKACSRQEGATVFGYPVKDPGRYGVVEFNAEGRVVSLEEKPENPRSHYAVPGLYFYDNQVIDIAANLKTSPRGELEITDVNRVYLERGNLHVEIMGRGYAWLDTGTPDSLLDAADFVRVLEKRQGFKIASPEEIAFRNGFIDGPQLEQAIVKLGKSDYGRYLRSILTES